MFGIKLISILPAITQKHLEHKIMLFDFCPISKAHQKPKILKHFLHNKKKNRLADMRHDVMIGMYMFKNRNKIKKYLS